MRTELYNQIKALAGELRAPTFLQAAEFIVRHNCQRIVETGCFRGIPADGMSTVIFGLLAKETGSIALSMDKSEDHVSKATSLLSSQYPDLPIEVHCVDSIEGLRRLDTYLDFLYCDSFDHDPANPGPCQRHQLAELGACITKLRAPCAVLLDDHIPGTGGKTLLSSAFLEDRGWRKAAEGYQLLYVKE